MVELERAVFARGGNPLEDFGDCLWTELRQCREPSVVCRRFELLDRLNAECLVDPMDSEGRKPGDVEHVEQSFGHRLAKLLKVARLAGLDEVANDGERR